MPPGTAIEQLGKKAWSRGKVDFVWIVWDLRQIPHLDANGIPFVPKYWIAPREKQARRRLAA